MAKLTLHAIDTLIQQTEVALPKLCYQPSMALLDGAPLTPGGKPILWDTKIILMLVGLRIAGMRHALVHALQDNLPILSQHPDKIIRLQELDAQLRNTYRENCSILAFAEKVRNKKRGQRPSFY